jgi:hypothetical protein
VSDDQVAKIRAERAEMQQQQMMMEQAQSSVQMAGTGAQAAKVLSEADTDGNNVLSNILGGMQ